MKKAVFTIVLVTMLIIPCLKAAAQNIHNSETTSVFDTTGFPQWAKDFRRWDIIAFGTFPFSMFLINFFNDLYRWNKANGIDFSAEGRRYAPWPFKSAGAIELTSKEFRNTIFFAIGLSAAFAFTDFFIVKMKRKKAAMIKPPPAGTYTTKKKPYEDDATEEELNVMLDIMKIDNTDAVDDDTGHEETLPDMDTVNSSESPLE
jgi:hypothetical protein